MLHGGSDGPSVRRSPIRVTVDMPAGPTRDSVIEHLTGSVSPRTEPRIVLVGVGADPVDAVDVDVGVVAAGVLAGGPGPATPGGKLGPRLVVIFTAADQQALDPVALLRYGVRAMLDTATPISHVGRAIDAAAAGAIWVEPALWQRLLAGSLVDAHRRELLDVLTAKELETLRLVADGLSNAQIAARQTVTVKTVKFHISNLLHKLGHTRRAELVALAHRCGLASK